MQLVLGGQPVDLRARVLVAGVVPAPRFGREGEVLATAATVRAAGADLADVSLPPRLSGPVARSGDTPVSVLARTPEEAQTARQSGAQLILVPPGVLPLVESDAGSVGVVVDDLAELPAARELACGRGLALAVDVTRWSGPDAVGREAAAVALGCRVIRTGDVRRSRRVAEVMAALLAARRDEEEA
ncbi:MAG TPA: hypothetical protein VH479_13000 [Acidimicrobiales bacterium]